MENEFKNKLEEQEKMLSAIYESVEKTRKYFLVVLWATVILFVLPLIGLLFAIPAFLSSYSNALGI